MSHQVQECYILRRREYIRDLGIEFSHYSGYNRPGLVPNFFFNFSTFSSHHNFPTHVNFQLFRHIVLIYVTLIRGYGYTIWGYGYTIRGYGYTIRGYRDTSFFIKHGYVDTSIYVYIKQKIQKCIDSSKEIKPR